MIRRTIPALGLAFAVAAPATPTAQLLPMMECNRQPVFQINGVTLARVDGRIEVQVDGVAATPLWTEPKLVPREPKSAERTLELEFTACRPAGYVVQVLVP